MQETISHIAESVNKQLSPIQLGEVGHLVLTYRSARIQQHGTVIQPPRHVWVLHNGVSELSHEAHIGLEDAFKDFLQTAIAGGTSFEIPGLGMCYRQEGVLELLPGKVNAQGWKADYGLAATNVKKLMPQSDKKNKQIGSILPKKSRMWWLQAAAVLLTVLLVNVLAISFLSENGKLNIRQVAELNPFDSLRDREEFTFEDSSDAAIIPDSQSADVDSSIAFTQTTPELLTVSTPTTAVAEEQEPVQAAAPKTMESVVVGKPNVNNDVKVHGVQVVVGAFASVENAENLKNKLLAKGWMCKVEKAEKSQLMRVMVFDAKSAMGEAEFLSKARAEINPHSWILAE